MAGITLLENDKAVRNPYGIKSETRKAARERLERLIKQQDVQAYTYQDFANFPEDEKTQADIRAEADEFMRMREEWRAEDRRLEKN